MKLIKRAKKTHVVNERCLILFKRQFLDIFLKVHEIQETFRDAFGADFDLLDAY